MRDGDAPRDPSGTLFAFVRRFVLVAGVIVVTAWVAAIVLWLALRLIDW